jgi:hypothetical protein
VLIGHTPTVYLNNRQLLCWRQARNNESLL